MESRFNSDVYETQRRLRIRLLDHETIRYAPARDLAAQMLLNLDDLPVCWSIAINWLRKELGCHRVDTGFGTRAARDYFPGFAQARHADFDVPSFGGKAVDNHDAAMQAMWVESKPVIFADIKHDNRVSLNLRQRLSGARTKSKFAWALRDENGSYGLICADWTEHLAPWESGLYDCFEHAVADVFCPIIAAAKGITDNQAENNVRYIQKERRSTLYLSPSQPASSAMLTGSEVEVAMMVAEGMSYKEIARQRNRSFSTIDHQLRSIRRKIGVSSTSELVSYLAKQNALSGRKSEFPT